MSTENRGRREQHRERRSLGEKFQQWRQQRREWIAGMTRGPVSYTHLAIARELGVPVKYAGVGEGIDDLRPFDALEFAQALI